LACRPIMGRVLYQIPILLGTIIFSLPDLGNSPSEADPNSPTDRQRLRDRGRLAGRQDAPGQSHSQALDKSMAP
jgi:hypothetical protein